LLGYDCGAWLKACIKDRDYFAEAGVY